MPESKKNKPKRIQEDDISIGKRIKRVIIPGSTGGFYTIFLGTAIIIVCIWAFIHSVLTGIPATGLSDMMFGAVGLLGVHTVRGAFADRGNAQIAIEGLDQTQPGQSSYVDTPSGVVSTEIAPNVNLQPVTEEQKESVKG